MAAADRLPVGEKYHVFLSFRGPETREGFTDCLFEFLHDAGLRVFMDDEEIRVGESIGGKIKKAIYDSKLFLPVFSRGYASSKWCLKEIAWMADCMEEFPGEKEMLPVFYDVDPNDVKLKTDLYTNALIEHEKTSGRETVEGWRKALKKVPEVKGWNRADAKGQGKLIKQITQHISRKLEIRHRILPDHFIGMEEQVQDVMNALDCGFADVRTVVIHGMGGIGKTTLASSLFNKICCRFQGCSFLSNVRELSAGNGIVNLQNKMLQDVLGFSSSNFYDANDAMNCIQGSFRNRDVLVVLDDVSDMDQIKKLVGMGDWLGSGSRAIITTRNLSCVANIDEIENNTVICRGKKIYIYEMRGLDFDHSLQLLSWHTFGKDAPPDVYDQPSRDILSLTGGVPLAIEVIGSHMRGRNMSKWEEMLSKLKKVPRERLCCEILMSSYEMLDDEEKEIFLDTAFLMAGLDKTKAFYYWEAGGLSPRISVDTLISYALVKIDGSNRLWMHDLLRDLGTEVDRKLSHGNLERRKFLCNEDAKRFLQKSEGTKHVQALSFDSNHAHNFTPAESSRLSDIRFLELSGGSFYGNLEDGCLSELRWFYWEGCALNFRETNFVFRKLAVLSLSWSEINETWAGWERFKTARSLKCLELKGLNLTKTPDFSSFSSLEILTISQHRCPYQVHPSIADLKSLDTLELQVSPEHGASLPSSIFQLKSLSRLVIHGFKLKQLPENIGELKGLKVLEISRCRPLSNLPDSFGDLVSLRELHLSHGGITYLPESMGKLGNLIKLDLRDNKLSELPPTIGKLRNLIKLDVSSNKLRRIPAAIGDLVRLEVLDISCNSDLRGELPDEVGQILSLKILTLSWTGVSVLPERIVKLSGLELLWLESCDEIQEVIDLPSSLTTLIVSSKSLKAVPELSSLTNLVKLSLCKPRGDDDDRINDKGPTKNTMSWIQHLQKLEDLTIDLPVRMMPSYLLDGLNALSRLRRLILRCVNPHILILPSRLECLELRGCTSMFPWECLSKLQLLSTLQISGSSATEIRLKGHEWPRNLTRLLIEECEFLERLDDISRLEKLELLSFYRCRNLAEIGGLGRLLGSLQALRVGYCGSIPSLPKPSDIETPSQLFLTVFGCLKLRDYERGPYKDYFQENRFTSTR